MDKKLSNIFLHYLNIDTQEIFGISKTNDFQILAQLKRGLNASMLLCKEYCFMPLGFFFECQNTKALILDNLEYVKEGYLRLCIREGDIKEYIEKKQGQLKRFADDVSYHGFFEGKNIKKISDINPVLLQRHIRVGEYCVNKWIEQHSLFVEDGTGDLQKSYLQIDNIENALKITMGIKNAALEVKNGAFIWKVIENRYKDLSINDRQLYLDLRIFFEKYYYEAYLNEYEASILYDYFLIDKGYDFSLKSEYDSVANYSWFDCFLKCLKLNWILELPANKIVELKNMPQFTLLLEIYVQICNDKLFAGDVTFLRNTVSKKLLSNENGINDFVEQIKCAMHRKSVKKCVMDFFTEIKQKSRKEIVIMEQSVLNKNQIDVLIIIATVEEENAIIKHDDWQDCRTQKGYTYYKKEEKMTFALARAVDMRETETSVVGQYFIDELKPKYIAMAGFCAGEEGETILGDVIIPHKIFRYGMGKRVSNDEKYPEIDSFKINSIWKQKIERFGEEWRKKCKVKKPIDYFYQRYQIMIDLINNHNEIDPLELWNNKKMPDVAKVIEELEEEKYIILNYGKIQLTDEGENHIRNDIVRNRLKGNRENKPSTKIGVLATGDDVQQWSGIFDELAKKYDRKVIALDMEAHAIGVLSNFNNIPYIVAKGVGDYAQKDKKFHNRYIEYSCHMSCRFIIEFFKSLTGSELI